MENTLRRKLQGRGPTFGSWVTVSHPVIAEYLAGLAFDWFVFDQEHSPLDADTTQMMIQGMSARGGQEITPLVRVAWNDQVRIKKALDTGAHGLLIPMVNSASDAQQAVAACRYPPEGTRGCGPSRALLRDPEYLQTANEEILVIVQIESEVAVENAAEILSTEGVDGYFLGPIDLSYSMGLSGDLSDEGLKRAIEHVRETGARLGVPGGIWQGAGKTVRDRVEEGWKMIALGFDANYMLDGARAALDAVGR
ncbi:MAG: HpcH/HpaI aldolase family protein [Spirochaetaceae bacterium]